MTQRAKAIRYIGRAIPLLAFTFVAFHGAAIEVYRAGVVSETRASGVQRFAGTTQTLSAGDAVVRKASIRTDGQGTVAIRMDDGSEVTSAKIRT
ncbi:MAG: hypothetical protein AAFN51_04675 [Pseudomonadota bacterium]